MSTEKPPFAFANLTYANDLDAGEDGKMARTVARENRRITEETERPPMSGMRIVGRRKDGNAIWGTAYAQPKDDAPQPESYIPSQPDGIRDVPHLRDRDPDRPAAQVAARVRKLVGKPADGADTDAEHDAP